MWVTLSIISLLISAICWIIGDALIVGLPKPDKTKYRQFIERMGDDAYAFYVGADERRLRVGALIADYSVPFMLFGVYAHYMLVRDSTLGVVGVVLMAVGISLSPLAHAAFYPLALTSQLAHRDFAAGEKDDSNIRTARQMFTFLKYAWLPAVGLTYAGSLLFCIPLVLGWTAFPWWAILFTPLVLMFPTVALLKLPYPGKPLLDGAVFNIILAIWAVAMLVLSQFYPIG
ncbi:DUF6796 family protein [Gephyromycinifex aptenodytis]|uniref:DUF6796 family protein n=1 Tax=Gephyromycinifex aptenodytis TaxID=2716227 RepID=UPI0014453E84|nr:DUF6796 family protein [Gephyromycinifex aptenodytis]